MQIRNKVGDSTETCGIAVPVFNQNLFDGIYNNPYSVIPE